MKSYQIVRKSGACRDDIPEWQIYEWNMNMQEEGAIIKVRLNHYIVAKCELMELDHNILTVMRQSEELEHGIFKIEQITFWENPGNCTIRMKRAGANLVYLNLN